MADSNGPPQFPLSHEHDENGEGPEQIWTDFEPEPTTIIVYWPHAEPPSQTEIMLAMRSALSSHQLATAAADAHSGFGDIEVLDELDTGGDAPVRWNAVVQVPHLPFEMIVWCEAAHAIPADEPHADLVQQCRWVVGFETMLDTDDPLTNYIELMRLIAETISDSPVVLDANTAVSHDRAAMEELFCRPDIEPPADVLWIIHIVALDEPGRTPKPTDDPDDAFNESMWVHTHGLRRCSRPELEMLAVNTALADSAAEMLDAIAEQSLHFSLPAPGEKFAVGSNMYVTAQPWQVAAEQLPDSVPGSIIDRQLLRQKHFANGDHGEESADESELDAESEALLSEDEMSIEPHSGMSAVICSPQPIGPHGDIWVCPQRELVKIANDEAIVFRSLRSTLRQQRLAQREWGQFATALATIRSSQLNGSMQPRFLVKAGFTINDQDAEEREHLWFEVESIEKDAAHAQLLNEPMYITSLQKGQSVTVSCAGVSDWIVHTPMGNFGPDQTRDMWSAIDELKDASQQS